MKAIILAAGRGTRLRPLTDEYPKCMVEFRGKSMIDQIIDTLRCCGIDDIIVVSGYRGDILERHLARKGIRFVKNSQYAETNMVYSLFCAEDHMNEDLLISYGDIIYSPKIVNQLIYSKDPVTVAVDLNWKML